MRYLVHARLKAGREEALLAAIEHRTLGRGSIAGDEYLRNMAAARLRADGRVSWVEVCYCATPLEEERPYWDDYFTLETVKDAHARAQCKHETGEDWWACSTCDCTDALEAHLVSWGPRFLDRLKAAVNAAEGHG